MPPTLAGFLIFIRTVMGISTINLPDDAPVIPMAYSVAIALVNLDLAAVTGTPGFPSIYALAVYNLGGDNIVNFAPDAPSTTYFTTLRDRLTITQWISGVIASSADQSTAESMLNPEFMKGFTMANLQNLKTQYGRTYLAFAQSYGPGIWGIS